MTDGKMFRCPFSANAERLRAIPQADGDFASIRGARLASLDQLKEIKKSLRWFLREKPSLDACDSCSGRTYGDPEINPGIQVKTPLEHLVFDRN